MHQNKQQKKPHVQNQESGPLACIKSLFKGQPAAKKEINYKTENKFNSEGTDRLQKPPIHYPKLQILSYKKGLKNIGNTCYMNSALQCLLKSKHFISQLPPNRPLPFPALTGLFCSLVNEVNQENSPEVLLSGIKKVVAQRNPIFDSNAQNDAVEFMATSLSIISEELNQPVTSNQQLSQIDHYNFKKVSDVFDQTKAKDQRICKSIIEDTFTGRYMVTYQCIEGCDSVYVLFQKFNVHYLDIPTQVLNSYRQPVSTRLGCKLEDCLKFFQKSDRLTGDNKMTCDRCKKETQSFKTMKIYQTNKILTVVLKRFDNGFKNQTRVQIPQTLELTNILVTVPIQLTEQNKYYRLYAAILHFGTLKGGHYIAVCFSQKENCWFEFNDSKVSKLKSRPDLSNAYAVFYQLQSKQQPKIQRKGISHSLSKKKGK